MSRTEVLTPAARGKRTTSSASLPRVVTYEVEGVRFDDLGPRRIIHYHDPDVRLRAAVVVDTVLAGPSGGGVRLASDLTLREIARLARAMTYKYALLGLPIGGAKAGIWLNPEDADRDAVLAAFREAIRPLVDTGAFVPGPDMGTCAGDFPTLFPELQGDGAAGLDEELTGFGVVVAARTACELLGRQLAESTVAIEGFGKVGTGAAKYFTREGAKLVAVSTVRAAIHDPRGLDVDALVALRAEGGDEAIERLPGVRVLPREALFALPADILVPGARPDAIHRGNASAIQARLIVPGSNLPYEEGILDALAALDVVALPDFVTNAGGVLATICAAQNARGDAGLEIVRGIIDGNVRRVLLRSQELRVPPVAAAIAIAREQLAAR
jgi:glutamate dehydrogenase (NAD(P)+)